ncbi:hypothetical protein D9756_007837 [Leucocoprinus leucothites]|uniref:lytic cellulose monooxygenase (C4-dehydrogenating) n=1 Tax=Leucocoprinus leucothites TaxID=201217 RepID=A0A8H5FYE7_9AGAR|nr:hypothetical protein D9756_007837 [Leucoagaricus leucothites]
MFASKLALIVASLLSAAVSVLGHGYVQEITNAGNEYSGYLPYSDPYMSPAPQRIVRKIPGNGPVTDLSLIEYTFPPVCMKASGSFRFSVQCNGYSEGGVVGSAPAPVYATVAAGSHISLNWTTWPESHMGPMITYMALAPSDITSWNPGTSAVWFKVDEMGKDSSGKWAATDILSANNSIYTFTVPKNLKPGKYIVRHEIIALHAAHTYPGAQVYPSCIQIEVPTPPTPQELSMMPIQILARFASKERGELIAQADKEYSPAGLRQDPVHDDPNGVLFEGFAQMVALSPPAYSRPSISGKAILIDPV